MVLSEYKKYVITGLTLQCKTIYPNKTSMALRQVNPGLDGRISVAAMAKIQGVSVAFYHLTLMDNCLKF